jgi:hypothetical protein
VRLALEGRTLYIVASGNSRGSRYLTFAAVLLAIVVPLWPKEKERSWQEAKVAAVFSPRSLPPGSQAPVDPHTTGPGQTPYPTATISGTAGRWVFIFEIGSEQIAAASESVPRNSWLARLARGDSVRLAIEGRTLYIAAPGGRQHRLKIVKP